MNRLFAVFKARELFAHRRIWLFWFIALIALALPWLWFVLSDQEPALAEAGNPAAVERHAPRPLTQAP